jgi:acyl-coenzyme A thioesterase PaaI-like protein
MNDADASVAALAALVEEIRTLVRRVVDVRAPAAVLDEARRGVAALTADLGSHAAAPSIPRYAAPGTLAPSAGPGDLMPYDPVLGPLSPLAPPVVMRWEDGKTIGDVTYTKAYEGPPGCVHGGIIALAFDQVLSMANLQHGIAGPTATLRLRFRRPTPLGVPLRYEGWRERAAGRRLHAAGRLLADGVVTVEAEGTFVHLPRGRVMQMLDP